MNNKDLLKAIGDIDEKYLIEGNDIKEKNRTTFNNIVNIMKNSMFKYALAPICVIIIAVIGVYNSDMFTTKPDIIISKKDDWIIKEVNIDKDKIEESIATALKWDEMSISQQFIEVEYNNCKYTSRITKISSDKILKNIGNSILTGYDAYTKTTHSKKVELYSIKELSEECVIAVKFEGESDYYVYVNSYYKPATLGQFIDDLRLRENTSFKTIYYKYFEEKEDGNKEYKNIEFYNVDNNIIWQMLFNNLNLQNIYSDNDIGKYTSEKFSQSIEISVDIELLGYENISVSLTDKGYLLTNILDTGKGFYIGEDKVQEFLNYIKENYDGYEIVYIDEKSTNVENNEEKENIIMTENKIKATTVIDIVTTKENKINEKELDDYKNVNITTTVTNTLNTDIISTEPYIPDGMFVADTNDNSGIKASDIVLNTKSENVNIEILNDTVTNTSVEILITDNNGDKFGWGKSYKIQMRENGEWNDLNPIKDLVFTDIAYNLDENNQLKQKINWERFYGKLERGTYRIVKPQWSNNEYIDLYSNEFEIK